MFTYTCEYEYVWICMNICKPLPTATVSAKLEVPIGDEDSKVPLVPPLSLLASLASCQTCHKTCHQSPSASACVLLEMWGRRRGAIKCRVKEMFIAHSSHFPVTSRQFWAEISFDCLTKFPACSCDLLFNFRESAPGQYSRRGCLSSLLWRVLLPTVCYVNSINLRKPYVVSIFKPSGQLQVSSLQRPTEFTLLDWSLRFVNLWRSLKQSISHAQHL